ncbi:MAG: hypothetical protein AB7O43_13900 [Hyphomicrobiaceae bacterium]
MADVPQIDIVRTKENGGFAFLVQVRDIDGESRHDVALARSTYVRLSEERYAPETCVEAAFRFLLDREPKGSILPSFDIERISHYFPDFERKLPEYFPRI